MGNLGACHAEETLPETCRVPGDIPLPSCTGNSTQEDLVNLQLLRACEHGDIDAIIEALAAGGDIETRQLSLMTAANRMKEQDEDFPRALESQEVLEFKDGGIHAVPDQDEVKEARRDRELECVTNNERLPGLTPLMQAAKGGKAMAVALLLDARAAVNSRDELGMQPLHFAASIGCRESCQYLIGARACPKNLDEARRNVFSCLPPRCIASGGERREWALLLQAYNGPGINLSPRTLPATNDKPRFGGSEPKWEENLPPSQLAKPQPKAKDIGVVEL